LSGIGAACHLQRECPDRSFAILEGRADLGGTWDVFRYPGVRSDSDMHTLGYEFKPWTHEKSIADGPRGGWFGVDGVAPGAAAGGGAADGVRGGGIGAPAGAFGSKKPGAFGIVATSSMLRATCAASL